MKKILSWILTVVMCCLSFMPILAEVTSLTGVLASAEDNSYKRLTLSTNTTGPRYHIDGNGNPVHLFGMARCQSHAF